MRTQALCWNPAGLRCAEVAEMAVAEMVRGAGMTARIPRRRAQAGRGKRVNAMRADRRTEAGLAVDARQHRPTPILLQSTFPDLLAHRLDWRLRPADRRLGRRLSAGGGLRFGPPTGFFVDDRF